MQFVDLIGNDHSAAAAKHFDVRAAALAQQIDHVLEVLQMTALITGYGDSVRIFLQGGSNNLVNRAVVAKMNDLGTLGHQDAAHDVDRCVVAIKQRGSRDKTDFVLGRVRGEVLRDGKVGHGGSLWSTNMPLAAMIF